MKCASYDNVHFSPSIGSVSYFLDLVPWTSHSTYLNFNFFICKKEMLRILALIISKGYGKN